MEASILFGYHIQLHDKCSDACTYVPDLMTSPRDLGKVIRLIKVGTPLLSIFLSSKKVLYVGVEIPSAWNENADSGPRITFDEQLRQTHQNNALTWNDWFDAYHTLHNQEIVMNETVHAMRIKCENETPCLFATIDPIKLEHLP